MSKKTNKEIQEELRMAIRYQISQASAASTSNTEKVRLLKLYRQLIKDVRLIIKTR